MMLDHLAQHREFGFEGPIARLKSSQFGNQHMHEMVLFSGEIHQLVVFGPLSNRGVDELFF